jgi:hypothetical protein
MKHLIFVLISAVASFSFAADPSTLSTYTLFRKTSDGTAVQVSRCQIAAESQSIACQPFAKLTPAELRVLDQKIQKIIQNQNVKSYALIGGGAIVGIGVGVIGGFVVEAPALFLGGSSATAAGVMAGGAVAGGATAGGLTHGVTQRIFKTHSSFERINAELSALLRTGQTMTIRDSEAGSQTVVNLVLSAKQN